MITIGRSEHRFSQLDKDLAWTAQAERVENLDNVYPNTAANGDSKVKDDEDKKNLQNQEEEFKHVMEQLSDLSAKLEASNEEVKALLDQNRAMEEQKEEVERNLRISSRSLLKAEDDVKEAQDILNTYLVTQSNDEDLRISEQAFAEQNLRLQEKKFAKLVCQLADSEAERLELKKEKLKWCSNMEEAVKTDVDKTLQTAELSQQRTLNALLKITNDHEKASKAATELETLLEIARKESHQTTVLLAETSNKLEKAENELTIIKEQGGKFIMTDKSKKKDIRTTESKELDDKSEVENKKLLRSNNVLSNNLAALKQRVASLEDEKIRSVEILEELKSEARLKVYDNISLSEKVASHGKEVFLLRDELDEKIESIKVVTGQKTGLEKKVKKLLKETEQIKEDHELEVACLLNKLHSEKNPISATNPKRKKKMESGTKPLNHRGNRMGDSHTHLGQDSAANDPLNPLNEDETFAQVCGNNNPVTPHLIAAIVAEKASSKDADKAATEQLKDQFTDTDKAAPDLWRTAATGIEEPATKPGKEPSAEKAAKEQIKVQATDTEKAAPDLWKTADTGIEEPATKPGKEPSAEKAPVAPMSEKADVVEMRQEISQEFQGVKLYYNRLVQASETISSTVADFYKEILLELRREKPNRLSYNVYNITMFEKLMQADFLAKIKAVVDDAFRNISKRVIIKDLSKQVRDGVKNYNVTLMTTSLKKRYPEYSNCM